MKKNIFMCLYLFCLILGSLQADKEDMVTLVVYSPDKLKIDRDKAKKYLLELFSSKSKIDSIRLSPENKSRYVGILENRFRIKAKTKINYNLTYILKTESPVSSVKIISPTNSTGKLLNSQITSFLKQDNINVKWKYKVNFKKVNMPEKTSKFILKVTYRNNKTQRHHLSIEDENLQINSRINEPYNTDYFLVYNGKLRNFIDIIKGNKQSKYIAITGSTIFLDFNKIASIDGGIVLPDVAYDAEMFCWIRFPAGKGNWQEIAAKKSGAWFNYSKHFPKKGIFFDLAIQRTRQKRKRSLYLGINVGMPSENFEQFKKRANTSNVPWK